MDAKEKKEKEPEGEPYLYCKKWEPYYSKILSMKGVDIQFFQGYAPIMPDETKEERGNRVLKMRLARFVEANSYGAFEVVFSDKIDLTKMKADAILKSTGSAVVPGTPESKLPRQVSRRAKEKVELEKKRKFEELMDSKSMSEEEARYTVWPDLYPKPAKKERARSKKEPVYDGKKRGRVPEDSGETE